jgi:hypothetical protein
MEYHETLKLHRCPKKNQSETLKLQKCVVNQKTDGSSSGGVSG